MIRCSSVTVVSQVSQDKRESAGGITMLNGRASLDRQPLSVKTLPNVVSHVTRENSSLKVRMRRYKVRDDAIVSPEG